MARLYYVDSQGKPGKKTRWLPTYRWWKRAAIMGWTVAGACALALLRAKGLI